MSERKNNITGILVFLLLVSLMIYLISFSNKAQQNRVIESINLTGNFLLDAKDYYEFAKLGTNSLYKYLNTGIIKARLEKHPYIRNAEVEFVSLDEVKVHLEEKKIYAVVLDNSEPRFITENFQVLPILSNTKLFDLPVISNHSGNINMLQSSRTEDLVQAFRIIEAINLSNKKLLRNLTEINLRNGGDIILGFSGINAPVLFGRGSEAEKILSLELLWNSIPAVNLAEETNYIDLRFSNKIYLGSIHKAGLIE